MNTFTLERNNYRRKLIMLVKQHPILWNKTQENYNRNRPQKVLAWHQISEQLDISADKLRRTWENLRDQYRRDLKREVRFGFKSKWRFFSDMDFIRAMVSCKEHESKENEFTDSDSELDGADSQQPQTQCSPISTTQVAPTTIQITTTPCSSTIAADNVCPTNTLPFQPIILSKQWQPYRLENVTQPNNGSATVTCSASNASVPVDQLKLPPSCDSSKDYTQSASGSLSYESLAKQEPDLDLELVNVIATVDHEECVHSKDNINAKEFQEPCVSTSFHKRPRVSTEEVSDTSIPVAVRSHTQVETDLNTKDDDYYFVMSLLPSLRQIPRKRKFPLRIGIMNLIAKDLEEACKE